MLEEKNDEIVSKLMSDFGLNIRPEQKVYVVHHKKVEVCTCKTCNGTGYKYLKKDGLKYKAACPDCFGAGHIYEPKYQVVSGTVENVEIHLYWEKDKLTAEGRPQSKVCVKLEKDNPFSCEYISVNLNDLFLTKESAEASIGIN